MCVCVFAWSSRGVEWSSLKILKPPKVKVGLVRV